MSCLPLALRLMLLLLLHSAFASLPAPLNLRVNSYNFRHVLSWSPGPGTPPGTLYQVVSRVGRKLDSRTNTTTTSMTLKLEAELEYQLRVWAFNNQTRSAKSQPISFTPFRDTVISPPKVILVAGDNYIHIHISLPKPDQSSGVEDVCKFYNLQFRVLWKKRHTTMEDKTDCKTTNFTLKNLERGTEYCVQVHTEITVKTKVEPSAWTCISTAAREPNRGPVVFGIVAALVVLAVGALMTVMLLLHYAGFICKLKATLPPSLMAALSQGYTLSPEKTIPDQISVDPDTERLSNLNNPTTTQPATGGAISEEEEEEEEEESGLNIYMDRPAGLSSSQKSGNMSDSRTLFESEEAPCLATEAEPTEECGDEDEERDEGAEDSFIPETGRFTGREKEEEEKEEEKEEEEEEVAFDSSGNVDLFSVTLGALAASEEEEQNTSGLISLSDLELLMTGSQEETPPSDEDCGLYEGCRESCTGGRQREEDEEDKEEDEEEEEEFSGYMRHT